MADESYTGPCRVIEARPSQRYALAIPFIAYAAAFALGVVMSPVVRSWW